MKLHSEFFPAKQHAQQHFVLLHGWASNGSLWRPLIERLNDWAAFTVIDLPGCSANCVDSNSLNTDGIVSAILTQAPNSAVYVGWSLGGQLATLVAAQAPTRVSGLLTVCSNPKFVASEQWPGMAAADFDDFDSRFRSGGAAVLARFDALQLQGDTAPRERRRQLRQMRARWAVDSAALAWGLSCLGELDTRRLLASLPQTQLHLLAKADALVPSAAANALTAMLNDCSNASVAMLEGGHVAPLAVPSELALAIQQFQQNHFPPLSYPERASC